MHALRDILEQAQKNGVAVGHFNVADLVILKAVFNAAQELNIAVMVGVSEGRARIHWCPPDCGAIKKFERGYRFPDLS